MNVGLYQSIAGMKSMWEQQQIIAANLSRSNVAGHRAADVAFEVPPPKDGIATSSNGLSSSPVTALPYVNFRQGALQPTENPTHLAIQGDSFFVVKETDGRTTYTRDGAFAQSLDGKLMLSDGAVLAVEGGSLLQVEKNQDLHVTPDGRAFSGVNEIGKIAVATFTNPAQDLEPAGNGRFLLKEGKKFSPGVSENGRIAQGFLESSNTEPIQQMINMMEAMRVYQANQQMASTQDGITGRLIQTAGEQ